MPLNQFDALGHSVLSSSASGYRHAGNPGSLGNMGTNGFSWNSSAPSATSMTGAYLAFGSGYVNPEDGNYRAFGFRVRCLHE